MTDLDDRLLSAVQGAYARITGNAALMTLAYPDHLYWDSGATWAAVVDLSATDNGMRLAQALAATVQDLDASDARLVYLRPGEPDVPSQAVCAYQGGTLTAIRWQQIDTITGDAALLCRWTP